MVSLSIDGGDNPDFGVKLRVPGWARNEVLPGGLYSYLNDAADQITISVNGEPRQVAIEDGYINLSGAEVSGKSLEIDFPMSVRRAQTADKVEENRGKVALEYGP